MNTIEELLDNGIELYTAEMMISDYSKRIGTTNGIYKIIDINYDFNIRGKIVTLECQECGKVITRTMISGRNKWSELIKSCECQKIKKREFAKAESEKFLKEKKALILEDAKSMIGTEYGDYSIISITKNEDGVRFNLSCDICGHEISAPYQSIKNNAERYKKCTKHYNPVKYDESYIGKKKNYLKVIGITRLENKHRAFLCECDCGNTTTIEPTFWEKEIVKSCGCMQKELLRDAVTIHGYSGDRLYSVWYGMKERCLNPKNSNYRNYGGRGIEVCPEWLNDFEEFRNWSLKTGYDYNAPKGECTLDRIDVNGNYEPSNCRWITIQEQNKNKRPSSEWKKRELKKISVDGDSKTASEWCEIYGVTKSAVYYRMKKHGLSFEDALKIPKITIGRPRSDVEMFGYSRNPNGATVKLRLNEEMRWHIERSAKAKGVTMSEYLRNLIKEDMKNR